MDAMYKRVSERATPFRFHRASEFGSLYVVFIMWRPWVVAFNAKDIEVATKIYIYSQYWL